MGRTRSFLVSLPERLVRSLVAVVGGAVHETAEVVLPRFVRRSRLYEATAKNLLRIAIELIGAVEREVPAGQPDAGELLKRKTAGNVVELGSIVAFGFSPLWLLAGASDISHGSRVYLESLASELKRAGVLAEEAELGTVDDVLSALEGTSGTTARLIDLPPLELAELRASLAELRASAAELPTPQELAALYAGLQLTAARERRSIARGLVRDRPRLRALRAQRRPRAPRHALPRGLEAAAGGGLCGLLAPRFGALSRRRLRPLRRRPNELDRPCARSACADELFTRFLPLPSTVSRVKLGLATLAAFVALVAALPAHGSTPMPWCGTSSSALDRLPDATSAYAVHVAYVRAPGAPDRFSQFAPRIVGDAAAFDAWWRSQDSTRTPRFDLFPAPGCASAFGALDISNIQLPRPAGGIGVAFQEIRRQLSSEVGFNEPEKAYLVYFDGPTGQLGDEHVCGQGARSGGFDLPGIAVVYLDSCEAAEGDSLRPVVAIHELVHVFGAVERSAPNSCQSGHVCDFGLDLMTAILTGEELEAHVLDSGRNDYYGHAGTWTDVQDSTFLERLDSPDRIPADASGRPAGRGRADRLRALLLARLDRRRRSRRVPPLPGRTLRPSGNDDLGAPARHGRADALLGSRRRLGRTSQCAGERALRPGCGHGRRRRAGWFATPCVRPRSGASRSSARRRWPCSAGRRRAMPAACAPTASGSGRGR